MSSSDVSVSNVAIGHGHLKIDGTSVGGISGGLTITKTTDVYDVYVDQLPTPIKQIPVKETFQVKTNLAEATLTNLRKAWNIPASKLTGTDTLTNAVLKIGVSTGIVEHTLEITGAIGNGLMRVVQVHRAVSFASEWTMQRDKETLFPVTFTCLADTTKPLAEEIATIVDVTSTE